MNPAVPGEAGLTSSLTNVDFAPLIPWPAIALLALAGILVVAYTLARRARGGGWRGLGFLVIVLALLHPSLVVERRDALPDVAVVVVDDSASQSIGDRRQRSSAALTELRKKITALPNLELRVATVGSDIGEDELRPSGTLMFEGMTHVLADVPRHRVAGAVLITDGQVHDVPADLSGLGFEAPIHVMLSGDANVGDRRLVVENAPKYGIVGQTVRLGVRIDDADANREPRLARLSLRVGNQAPKIRYVPVGERQEIPVAIDHAGATVVELAVDEGPAEVSLLNNRAVVAINGVRDRLRVLLISGEAHTGERVWRNLLKADPSVDLVHFTILRPPEKQDGTPIRELALISFPIRELFEIKLDEFDLVILDRFRRRGVVPLAYLGNVARFVEEGGALLTAAGPAFATAYSLYRTPLNLVLPGRPTGGIFEIGYQPRLSEIGERHPVTAFLPGTDGETPNWGRWFRQIEVYPERGRVLMDGIEGKPILILERVGKGRVAQLMTDHMWLWARGFEGGGPQAEILRRLAHWLMKEPDLEEDDLRAVARGNKLEIVRQSLTPENTPVTVTAPSGTVHHVRLEEIGGGRAKGVLTVEEPGLYRLGDGKRAAAGVVGDVNPIEFADLRASAEILAPLAQESGGGVVWLAQDGAPSARKVRSGRDTAGRGWIGFKANEDYVVTGIEQATLLPSWLALILAVGGFMLAWRAEGR